MNVWQDTNLDERWASSSKKITKSKNQPYINPTAPSDYECQNARPAKWTRILKTGRARPKLAK